MSDGTEEKPENLIIPFGVYSRLIEDIKHYETVQATYRAMTSSLLLATYAAIGFMYSIKPSSLPLNAPTWACFIGGISLAIIFTMAILDLFFQERLMIANAIEVLKFEAKYAWLPKIQHRLLTLTSHPSSPKKKAWFYIGCGDSLILVIGLAILYHNNFTLNVLNIVIAVCVLFFLWLYGYLLRRISKSFEDLIRKHFDFAQIKKMKLEEYE